MKPILANAVLASAALFASFLNVPNAAAVQSPAAIPVMAQLLFVQNAHGVAISADGKTLTLKGLSPTTLFFSDRPVRIAGHYRAGEYLEFWKAGPDSFLKDPPNATLSAFQEGKDELSDVVVTLRNPRVEGKDLSYDITVISGKLPTANAGPVSLFIDIIGLPFTPLSFAGVARRTAYRTVVWGNAAAVSAESSAAAVNEAQAAAQQASIAAAQAQSAAAAAQQKTPQQKLQELQSLYDQKLISASDYEAAKKKILNELTQ
jgi:hypothetical protein